jgi:hypothetical protein
LARLVVMLWAMGNGQWVPLNARPHLAGLPRLGKLGQWAVQYARNQNPEHNKTDFVI